MEGAQAGIPRGFCPDITGIILAGGHSTRMGSDKALLHSGGIPIIQHIRDVMQPHFPELLLSTNTPERYTFLSLPSVRDIIADAGPLAGIHAALTAAAHERICVMSCDAAGVTGDLLDFLCAHASDAPAVVLGDGARAHPLMAVYHRTLLPLIAERLRQGVHSMHGLLDAVTHRVLQPDAADAAARERMFQNLNTPEDYARFHP